MARKVSINGKLTGIPGMYSRGLELAGPLSVPPLEQGVVALIARSDGGMKPQTPILLRSARGLSILGGGNLGKGVDALFHPSRDDRRQVRGASSVIAIRPEAALQASADVNNNTPAALFSLLSAAYGLLAGSISYQIAAGSRGGPSKKLTTSKVGEADEEFDDIGFLAPMLVRYTGDASTAVLTVTSTQMAVTLAGDQTDSSLDLTADFSVYDTLSKLAAYINAQPQYEAVLFSSQPDVEHPDHLDYIASTSVATKTGTLTTSNAITENFTSNITGIAVGDVVKAGNEFLYVTSVTGTNGTAIRGYLDSVAEVHTGAAAVSYHALTDVTYQLMEVTNDSSSRLQADNRTTAPGVPDNMGTKSFLTFPSATPQPLPTLADYKAALEQLDGYNIDFVVMDSMDPSIHQELSKWLAERWGTKANETQAHVGTFPELSISQIRSEAKALQDPNISLWPQEATRNEQASLPWLTACVACGIQAGMAPGTPLTSKSMRVDSLKQNTALNVYNDDAETLVEIGASFGRYDGDDVRIVRCLSTYTSDDTFFLISPNVRYAIARTEKLVRHYIKTRHFGKRGASGDAQVIKATIIDALEEAKSQGLIVDGAKRESGVLVPVPAFDPAQIFVERTGNVIEYELAYVPVDGNDFFIGGSRVAQWRDAA